MKKLMILLVTLIESITIKKSKCKCNKTNSGYYTKSLVRAYKALIISGLTKTEKAFNLLIYLTIIRT